LRAARTALQAGHPVLVQVPRRGYVPALACARCRTIARCRRCTGPLSLPDRDPSAAVCRWCGREEPALRCVRCGSDAVRAVVIGARRTAEELGRAFPGTTVLTSGGDAMIAAVVGEPALVVATPGAEPPADGGFAAALLLDGWALLGRSDLRAGEEALRRWLAAAALVRPATEGGAVVVVADGSVPQVQALLRWDPGGYASRELADRVRLRFPPAVLLASLTGSPAAVADLLQLVDLPPAADVLGPLPVEGSDDARALVRAPLADARGTVAALKAAQATRSARKSPDFVTVRVDPLEVG
jgi:primosomal protein N' (replication factor Y) (superfamily II helicase)